MLPDGKRFVNPPRLGRVQFSLLAIAALSALTVLLFYLSLAYFRTVEIDGLQGRLSLYTRSLSSKLDQFLHLPYVLSQDLVVSSASNDTSNEALNRRFADFAQQAGLEAIYLMDPNGLVVAASNYAASPTFLGQNYGFRPYFKAALAGRRGEYFGVGATTSRAGYFIAEPVADVAGSTLGVVAIKLDMTGLQKSWENSAERVFISNEDGVIVLSSVPEWLYRTLSAVSPDRLETIQANRQFGKHALQELEGVNMGTRYISVSGHDYLHLSQPVGRLGWRIHYLSDEDRVYERAIFTVIVLGVALSVMLLIAMMLRSARITSALKASLADRQNLQSANTKLEQAQAELARTSKLAALGQLSASVTHELGQPISALRNHLAAAELDGGLDNGKTIQRLTAIVDRMENITRQLRFFARPSEEKLEEIALQTVLDGVLVLVDHDLRKAGVNLRILAPETPIVVIGNRVRLEQAVVNLVRNAIAAMEQASASVLTLSVTADGEQAELEISDTGAGFGDMTLDEMSEPFKTTRPSGDGMGLGLSIAMAIVKEHGGKTSAISEPDSGATFIISLPLHRIGE